MTINYQIINHEYFNTGGHCMVTICDVYLPDSHKLVFVYCHDGWANIYNEDFIRSEDELEYNDSMFIAGVNFFEEEACDEEQYNSLLHECYSIHEQYIESKKY